MPFILLCVLLGTLWLAGGASRGDVLGQVVVRAVAWGSLILMAVLGRLPKLGPVRPVLLFLLLAVALALLQLVPLPPGIWQALPGRDLFAGAADVAGQPQPWRPLSIVPDATVNAAGSLIVPLVTLILVAALRDAERRWLPVLLLGLITLSMLLGLAQFAGSRFNNPLINDTVGQISASFANRNHLALFLSFGCLLTPAWAFPDHGRSPLRAAVGLGMIVVFVLTILATGSRTGLLLGAIGLATGAVLVRRNIVKATRQYPRWVLPTAVGGAGIAIVLAVLVAIRSNRAVSIDRVLSADGAEDMRSRALPTVLDMIGTYFPWGSGLGGFDPIFRIHEPLHLLKLTYFNHAHNDILEIVLDTGIAGASILVAAILWWAIASFRAWRAGPDAMAARIGSTMLGLTIIASLVDYPARTPMIMSVLVIAATWLCQPKAPFERQALRGDSDNL